MEKKKGSRMKVLMINKFLYPNGGSETYIFKVGDCLTAEGDEVEYFGMDNPKNVVGNSAESYTSNMDFHTGKLARLLYPFKIIYSAEARRKLRKVLDQFEPDVVHINNFNFQLTPSILYEIHKKSKQSGKKIPIILTAHDGQLVCPNHLMLNPKTGGVCEKCLGGNFGNCTKYRCIHSSFLKSLLGTIEARLYKLLRTYRLFDVIICPSEFLKIRLDTYPVLKEKTMMLHNFIDAKPEASTKKEDYVLYFGRYSSEKGIDTLLKVCSRLPEIPFVFAGGGPLENQVAALPNVENKGFLSGKELAKVIAEARFSVYPSEWYENCPFSVMESQQYGTPVLGASIGGIPELIQQGKTGELFESGNSVDLEEKIKHLWYNKEICSAYASNCKELPFDTLQEHCAKLRQIYQGIAL